MFLDAHDLQQLFGIAKSTAYKRLKIVRGLFELKKHQCVTPEQYSEYAYGKLEERFIKRVEKMKGE